MADAKKQAYSPFVFGEVRPVAASSCATLKGKGRIGGNSILGAAACMLRRGCSSLKMGGPMVPRGVKIGHASNVEAATGCTVILCEKGATAGVDVRGGGPATRETDLLRPENMVQQIHVVVLSDGSAFGLDAASGVMRWLEERGHGFDVGVAQVPLVCGASLFDLQIGRADVRPDAAMGYAACEDAACLDERPVAQGNVGGRNGRNGREAPRPAVQHEGRTGVCACRAWRALRRGARGGERRGSCGGRSRCDFGGDARS